MNRNITILMFNSILASTLCAQSISPLEQAMTSTSLISRPSIFRDMQASIDTEIGRTKPGLQIAGLHEAIGAVRDKIIGFVTDPAIWYTQTADSIHFAFQGWNESFEIPKIFNEDSVCNRLRKAIKRRVESVLDRTLDPLDKPNLVAAFVDEISSSLKNSDLAAGVDFSKFDTLKGREKLASVVSEIFVFKARNYVDKTITVDVGTDAGRVAFCNRLQSQLKMLSSDVRSRLIHILNDAENELSNGVDEVSKRLVALNTGIGITQGKGAFNGGIYLSVVTQQWLHVGVYVNGQLSQIDSTAPTESLAGLHAQFALDPCQIDLLAAGLFGDRNFGFLRNGEAGFGISGRTGPDLIVGGAVYALWGQLHETQWTFGVNLQPAKMGWPSIYIALQGPKLAIHDLHPVIQTSVPILPSL